MEVLCRSPHHVMLRRQHFIVLLSIFWLLDSFHVLFLDVLCGLVVKGLIQKSHSEPSYSWHFDQLCIRYIIKKCIFAVKQQTVTSYIQSINTQVYVIRKDKMLFSRVLGTGKGRLPSLSPFPGQMLFTGCVGRM